MRRYLARVWSKFLPLPLYHRWISRIFFNIERSSQLFNIVKRILSCLAFMWSEPKAVDIDYSCLWIFLRAARMKDVLW